MISSELLVLILINTVFFLVLIIKSLVSSESSKYEFIRNSEIAILGIAFTQYALTFIIENSNVLDKDANTFAQDLRYFDWLFTTPLLLYSYWKLAEVDGYDRDFFLLFAMDVVMILSGLIAERVQNKSLVYFFYLIGCLAYVVIFTKVLQIMDFFRSKGETRKKNLGYYFILGWLIYPIGFLFGDNLKYVIYSIGDFINKGLSSLSLNEIIIQK